MTQHENNVSTPYLTLIAPPEYAQAKTLIIFGHAGSTPETYTMFARQLAPEMQVFFLSSPGWLLLSHGITPMLFTDYCNTAARKIAELNSNAVYFLGHSFGVLAAHTIADLMSKGESTHAIEAVFLCCRQAPNCERVIPRLSHEISTTMHARLKEAFGTPFEIDVGTSTSELDNVLRCDLAYDELFDGMPLSDNMQLMKTPMVPIAGEGDSIGVQMVQAWQHYYINARPVVSVRGGHFFLLHRPDEAASTIRQQLPELSLLANGLEV